MEPRCSVFIATSLDGYIARSDGSINWLEAANAQIPAGEDCGYSRFMESVDALVMGRHTFERVLGFPDWPYGDKPVWVCSLTMESLPAGIPGSVELVREDPVSLRRSAQSRGWRRLYIDGGRLIQSFLRAGLIDDLTITTIPVLIGDGRPLFGELASDVQLQLVQSRAFPFGFVQSDYRVMR